MVHTSNYSNIEYIGEGSQAVVLQGVSKKSNKKVAIKLYHNSNSLSCMHEIRMLKKLQKLNIKHSIQLVESFVEKNHLLIVTEFAQGKELHDFLLENKIQTFQQLKAICKKILVAVDEIHENNICHLDLKLENIMIDEKTEAVKLIDFGFSEITADEAGNEKLMGKFKGSVHYAAPEIIRNIPYDGKKADIWALGVLFYTLTAQKFPFHGDDDNAVACSVLKKPMKFTRDFNPSMIHLIDSMTHPDPSLRPSAKNLLQLSFFNN